MVDRAEADPPDRFPRRILYLFVRLAPLKALLIFNRAEIDPPDRFPRRALENQCLKCRIPVKTMARPASSAAAMTSASRMDPPG